MKHATSELRRIGMERPRVTRLSEYSLRNVLKVFAAFMVGGIAMFAGAVVYSRSHQSWASVKAASAAPAQRAALSLTQAEVQASRPRPPLKEWTTTAAAQFPPPSSASPEQTGQTKREPEQTPASAEPAMGQPPPAVPQLHGLPLLLPQFAPLPPSAEAQPMLTLQPGLGIPVRLEDTLSSDRNRVGDSFNAALDARLVVQGFLVAGNGATVLGRISSVRKARLLGGKAKLMLTLTELTTRDGHRVRIESNEVEVEGSRGGIVGTAKMATGAATGAVVGALKGAAEGAGIGSPLRDDRPMNRFAAKRTATLAAGTEITFKLTAPVRVAGQANR